MVVRACALARLRGCELALALAQRFSAGALAQWHSHACAPQARTSTLACASALALVREGRDVDACAYAHVAQVLAES